MDAKPKGLRRAGLCLLLAALGLGAGGCVTAAAAGAGTVAGIEYTNRGAKGDLQGSVDDVANRARQVFDKQGIVTTEVNVEEGGTKRVLGGRKGDLNVSVDMTASTPNVTHVEVVAQKSPVQWDKDYAKSVMQKIASKS